MSLRTAWTAIGLVCLNAAVLFGALNLAALLALVAWPDRSTHPRLDDRALAELYPGYSLETTRRLLDETWGRKYVYEPFTQFREGSQAGELVTVHSAGFRPHAQDQPWPPPAGRSIFFFGGSTTFGYGEKDEATLAFFAQEALRRGCADDALWVYNFARSNYFSTQERILFEQLLLSGFEPAAAVFVDGVNEFLYPHGEPKFTQRLAYLMAESDGQLFLRAAGALPLVELLQRVSGFRAEKLEPRADERVDPTTVVSRWFTNRSLIRSAGGARGVSTYFVWQPSPAYALDLAEHLALEALGGGLPHQETMRAGYEAMAERLTGRDAIEDTLWLADGAPSLGRPLYVDRFHYSSAFAEFLGNRIGHWLEGRLCSQHGAGGD